MLAKLHLAEDAFALHLLLQHLEGLVDIVVTYENLHAVFLFNPMVDRPNGQGVRVTGVRFANAAEPISIRPLTGNEKLCQIEQSPQKYCRVSGGE